MKKYLLLCMMIGFAATSFAQVKTIYLNSSAVPCNVRGVKKDCLQYKWNETDSTWNILTGKIGGFTYNPGYFYTLQVQTASKTDPPVWKLVKQISKTKSTVQQPVDTGSMLLMKPPTALVGRWNIVRISNESGDVQFTPENEFLQFDPAEMKVTGQASCNKFFGNYTADSTKQIHFEALGHTMMACPNLATENKMLKALELVDSWMVEGSKLYLRMGSRTLMELTKVISGQM